MRYPALRVSPYIERQRMRIVSRVSKRRRAGLRERIVARRGRPGAEPSQKWALLPLGAGDKLAIDSIEHQLRATEHLEVRVVVQVAPRQVHEAVAPLAMNRGAFEVNFRVRSRDDSHGKFPSRARRIARDELEWLSADLHPDVDVAEWTTFRVAKDPTRKIEAIDHNSHTGSLAPRGPVRGLPKPMSRR